MDNNLYISVLLLVTTCGSLFIAALAWRRRENPISISLFFGMIASAFYSFGYAFEISSSDLETIQFWLKVEYIGISFGPFIWFAMVLHYTNQRRFLRKWELALLGFTPLTTFIMYYTNEWHQLFYTSMSIDTSTGSPHATFEAGSFYLLHVAYSYLLFLIGMWLLIQMYRKSALHLKKQIAFMMIGSTAPFGITMLYLTGLLPSPIDFSPFGFLFSGIFYTWGIYQYNMLNLVPVAAQKVFESMKDAVIVFDLDDRMISFNRASVKIFPLLHSKKAIGMLGTQLFKDDPELLEILVDDSFLEGRVRMISGTSTTFYHVQVSQVSNRKKTLIGKMILLSDVTGAVIAEETLRNNERQLRELNTFKDKMFTVVAHDIRDPLAILINLMDLLRDELKVCGEEHEEVVEAMEHQLENTYTLVEGLLDWFRSQSGGMVFNPIVGNLSEIVQEQIRLLQVQCERKRIQLVLKVPVETLVYADREMLNVIIRNLLANAIKFTEAGGRIEVTAVKKRDMVTVSVSDTGIGMAPEQANDLLHEEFPTPVTGTSGEKGLGLGLTLCREFIRINGGDLWFHSGLTQGSVFSFSLPTNHFELGEGSG
jgi:signal transduction histidine kinase